MVKYLAWIAPLPQKLLPEWVSDKQSLEISETDQQALQNSLTETEKTESLAELLKIYSKALPWVEWSADGWSRWRLLAPHLDAFLVHLGGLEIERQAIPLMYEYARWMTRIGRAEHAEVVLRRALKLTESIPAGEPSSYQLTCILAIAMRKQGDLTEAEALNRKLLEINPNNHTVLNNLALLLTRQDQLAEAEPMLLRSIELAELEDGPGSAQLIPSLNHLAELYQETDRPQLAFDLNRRALALARKHKLYATVARCATYLAVNHQAARQYEEAGDLLVEAMEFFSSVHGESHSETLAILISLAINHQLNNQSEKGLELLSNAIERIQKSAPESSPISGLLQARAEYLIEENDLVSAILDLKRALTIQQKIIGENHPHNWKPVMKLADLYYKLDNNDNSVFWYMRAVDLAEKSLSDLQVAEAADRAAQVQHYRDLEVKDFEGVASLYQRCVDILVKHPDMAPWLRRVYSDFLFLLSRRETEVDRGIALAQASLKISEQLNEATSDKAAETHRYLAQFYSEKRRIPSLGKALASVY